MEKSKKNLKISKGKTLKKFENSVKGITLVALVVTIIVLLILAGIAINLTIGENGIVKRASEAKIVAEQASILEQMNMEISAKFLDAQSMQVGYIEYLRSTGIIKDEVITTSELVKYASIDGQTKLSASAEETKKLEIKYIVDIYKLINDPFTGKGNLETGDVYYILNGNLYYVSESKQSKLVGNLFKDFGTAEIAKASYFKYVTNANNEIEITGFDIDNIAHQNSTTETSYTADDIIKVNIEVFAFPTQIEGKDVTKIDISGSGRVNLIIQGIKRIIFPETLKTLIGGGVIFEDLETIDLNEGLEIIGGNTFFYSSKVKSITIPASVKKITGKMFSGWSNKAIVNIKGKNSKEDFEEIDEYFNSCGNDSKVTVKYLGK